MDILEQHKWRQELSRRIAMRLRKQSAPRAMMFLIVSATGLAGFLATTALLFVGLDLVWLRYSISVIAAYSVFIGFIGVWVYLMRRSRASEQRSIDSVNLIDVPYSHTISDTTNSSFIGGGGKSGGGGATGSFGPTSSHDTPSVSGSAIDVDLDIGDFVVVLAILAALLSAAIVSIFMVVNAPGFFADVLIDGVLATALYRRMSHTTGEHWIGTVIRRTIVPFIIVFAFFVVAGIAMHFYMPSANSIGDVWRVVIP